MPDEYGNKTPEEIVSEQEIVDTSGGAMIESMVEATIWAKNPASAKLFSEINKDLALANLTAREIRLVRIYLELAAECAEMGFAVDARFFLLKAYSMCVSSLSLDGFGQKGIAKITKDVEIRGGPNQPSGKKQGGKNFWEFWK